MAFCPSRVRLGGWYGIIVLLCVRYMVAPVWCRVHRVHARTFEMPRHGMWEGFWRWLALAVAVGWAGHLPGCSTSGVDNTATKRSLRANASSGSSPQPHTCSPQAGQCSEAWTPSVAVLLACQRDQPAKFSNSRAGPSADTVIRRGWC